MSPFLSDLVIVVLFFSAFTLYFKNQLLINKNLKKFIYIFSFLLCISLSSALSSNNFISLKSSIA